jgi:putative transposase
MRSLSTNKTVYSANYHLIWCPKDRRRVLVGSVDARLKGRSSRLVRMEFPRLRHLPVLWSPSWVVSTVGGVPLEVVRRYVGNQKAVAPR